MLAIFGKAALEAGAAILHIYHNGMDVSLKADDSPVTQADEIAEEIIVSALTEAFPDIPVIAEEAVAAGHAPDIDSRFFLVDPLDGTKEFINKSSDFTVNIALIDGGVPVAGVVYAPALGVAYAGEGDKAWKMAVSDEGQVTIRVPITSRTVVKPPVGLISRSHCDAKTHAFVAEHAVKDCRSIGSSLKFCMLAEGGADVYPRFTRTMEWDTAAGDAVLRAAGGRTLGLDGKPLLYGKRNQAHDSDFANPSFIAWGRAAETA
ncbi:3'(2'), 5'-bisphosphate nucleotidase [Neorhizobium huautlense]|uniref:3'(2'),5'-bisphosphate nucleotidase CysQ n=1 Tax=Neorhizobium huautlense TaxID=67774 RepID=A0ABT9Q0L6_9HYPH|nr:3'(2'),5'-bisphosphate nucleotidase CysQ [Neorhizobium huautlense]MDP9840281.1 3'(2'), 5'-bisphosphate nucleotidase [Neorhizobium huautlense]